jgi:hypothetical protein
MMMMSVLSASHGVLLRIVRMVGTAGMEVYTTNIAAAKMQSVDRYTDLQYFYL